ncbi:MAG TPA: glycoside hydrolase family 16 protein [Gemmatimonadaceae bacterium]|jgi:beta-glucanase (GH16 family)
MIRRSLHRIVSCSAVVVLIACGRGPVERSTASPPPPPTNPTAYELVWADEFNGGGLPDPTKWGYDIGDGCPNICGWGNNELEHYTANRTENARVENGNLVIEARREQFGTRDYTSARLVSKNKGDWIYGRIEVRAKLPSGRGTWPAIWMLPTDWLYGGWPSSGEIDIMEHVGFAPDSVHGSIHTAAYNHTKGTQSTSNIVVANAEQAFHVYAIEWMPDVIAFYVDSSRYHSFANEKKGSDAWPFDQRFHLLLNIAVGGNWGGQKGVDQTIWPQQMVIDYVRVYQRR